MLLLAKFAPTWHHAWGVRGVFGRISWAREKEQNTWPRIAASEEWKIGRVRITALVRRNRFSTWSKSRYRSTACSGVILALVEQHEDAIETCFLRELAGVDRKAGPSAVLRR